VKISESRDLVSEFANCHLLNLGPYLSWRLGNRGPVFRYWLEQTVNFYDNLGLSKTSILREVWVILGMWP
jgi:hypothetical protein